MTDMIEIPTANLGFSTTVGSKKLSSGYVDNDRQPEMTIWECLYLSQENDRESKFEGRSVVFDNGELKEAVYTLSLIHI